MAPGRVVAVVLHAAADDEKVSNAYMPILVQTPEGASPGGTVQVEGRPSDTVRVLKAMIQLQIGVDEDKQELATVAEDDKPSVKLADGVTLADAGLEEGSKLVLTLLKDEPGEGDEEEVQPEGTIRIYVKCDVAPGKNKTFTLYVSPQETGKEVKERAYELFAEEQPAFNSQKPAKYGLFKPNKPLMDKIGNLRWLEDDERMVENLPGDQMGLEGDEEFIFASLIWTIRGR